MSRCRAGIEAGRDAEMEAVGDDQLERRGRGDGMGDGGGRRWAGTDVDREEGGRAGSDRR